LVRNVLAYAAVVVIWSTTWLAIKVSLGSIPVLTGVGLRFVVAAFALCALGAALKPLRITPAEPGASRRVSPRLVAVLAFGLFGANYVLVYVAETRLTSGLVAVLFGAMPFFVFAFGRLMLREHMTWRMPAGALLALAGVAAISLTGAERGSLPYVAAGLGAPLLAAFATVYLKKHAPRDPFATLSLAMLVAGTVTTVIAIAADGTAWTHTVAAASVAALIYLAVFGSSIAFLLNTWLLGRLPVGVVGLSSLMIPPLALLIGIAYGHERFEARDLLGAALVVAGMRLAIGQKVPIKSISTS
jgi:drug/metabolite transporter (DMT)-like permease